MIQMLFSPSVSSCGQTSCSLVNISWQRSTKALLPLINTPLLHMNISSGSIIETCMYIYTPLPNKISNFAVLTTYIDFNKHNSTASNENLFGVTSEAPRKLLNSLHNHVVVLKKLCPLLLLHRRWCFRSYVNVAVLQNTEKLLTHAQGHVNNFWTDTSMLLIIRHCRGRRYCTVTLCLNFGS